VASWSIDEVHRQPEVQVYFVDPSGRELLDRRIRGRPIAEAGSPPAQIVAIDGTSYRVLVRRTRGVVFDLWNIFLQPWVLAGLALLISGVGSAWLAWRLTRPILRLRTGVRAVASGDLEVRLGSDIVARRDELGGLARDFDQMTSDLRALIASKEELLRDISHELRSPLSRLRLASGLARRGARGAREEPFERIDREVERLDAMIGQILKFSKLGAGPAAAHEAFDFADLIEEVVEDARIEADGAGVTIQLVSDGPAWVVGERGQLRSAVENVLRNAVRFSPTASRIEVRLTRGAQELRAEVSDTGPGLRDADLARVFEPFYRADAADGVGLGLAITQKIVVMHGGRILARNLPQSGLCVEIILPRSAEPAPRGGGAGARRRTASHRTSDA
jgi:two-component system sensor histidine kinase CpxA